MAKDQQQSIFWVLRSTGNVFVEACGFLAVKTRKSSRKRFLQTIKRYCRDHRHLPVACQQQALKRRVQGYYNYFGVNGNIKNLEIVGLEVTKIWYKWLCRRSQRTRLTWIRFTDISKPFHYLNHEFVCKFGVRIVLQASFTEEPDGINFHVRI